MTKSKRFAREWLIKLLNKAVYKVTYCNGDGETVEETQRRFINYGESKYIADLLLENGVIVPACKLGAVVYYRPCRCDADLKYPHIRQSKVKQINFSGDWEWIFTDDAAFERSDVGKSVFFTREEAEEALKKTLEKSLKGREKG